MGKDLTDDQVSSMKEAFTLFDTDGDGVSDLIEYEDCAIKPPAVQMMTNCMCDGSDPNVSPLTRGDFLRAPAMPDHHAELVAAPQSSAHAPSLDGFHTICLA